MADDNYNYVFHCSILYIVSVHRSGLNHTVKVIVLGVSNDTGAYIAMVFLFYLNRITKNI